MNGKSTNLDQTPRPVASDLGLHCLLRPVCPNPYVYHGIGFFASQKIIKANESRENKPDSSLLVLNWAVKYRSS